MFRTAFFGAVLTAAGVIAACQEPDPNYGDPSGIYGKKLPGETGGPGTTSTTSSSGDAASGSSGGGTTAPAPTITLAAAHADGGGPAPPVTADCLSCHGGSGPATAKFAFGGSISNAAGATITVVVDGVQPTATDDAGYFWSTDTAAIAAGSNVNFYKDGQNADKMPGLPAGNAGGGCLAAGSCHGGSQGAITL